MPELHEPETKGRLRGALYFTVLFLALRFTGRGDPLEILETALFPQSKSFAAATVPLIPLSPEEAISSRREASQLLLLLHDQKEVAPITIYYAGAGEALKETSVGGIGGHLRASQDVALASEPVVASLDVPPQTLVTVAAKVDSKNVDFRFSAALEERSFSNPGDIVFRTANQMREARFFYLTLTIIFTLAGLTLPGFSKLTHPGNAVNERATGARKRKRPVRAPAKSADSGSEPS